MALSKVEIESLKNISPNTPAAERQFAARTMLTANKQVSDRWAREIARANASELTELYQRCQDLKSVAEHGELYGPNAVDQLRIRHDLSEDSIRDYMNIATNIDPRTFKTIMDFNELALTYSRTPFGTKHLICLAKIGDEDVQNYLIHLTITVGLTAEEMIKMGPMRLPFKPVDGATGTRKTRRPITSTVEI